LYTDVTPILQCNLNMSVWSMYVYNTSRQKYKNNILLCILTKLIYYMYYTVSVFMFTESIQLPLSEHCIEHNI